GATPAPDGTTARIVHSTCTQIAAGAASAQRPALRAGPRWLWSRLVKFAFISPRYGADIITGAEHACRLLAQQVSERHDVEVLTTCAGNSATWKNEYAEGPDRIRGVMVRRFAVTQAHDATAFERLSTRL